VIASAASGFLGVIFVLIGLFVAIGLYFIPAIIAYRRNHHQRNAISVLNLVAGWTFVGWVAALVWAMTAVDPTLQQGEQP
jgi:hypothetical protein